MARAASRRAAPSRVSALLSSRVLAECVGIGLVGAALLAGLALASHAPADLAVGSGAIANRAGVIGAAIAALLFGVAGWGAVIPVLAIAWIGGRLVLDHGLPPLASRFWVAVPLLLVSIATLPPLVTAAFPEVVLSDGGALGAALAQRQGYLLGSWGGLLLNGVLLAIGLLCVLGISTGAALQTLGVGVGWLLAATGSALLAVWSGAVAVVAGLRAGLLRLAAGVRSGARSLVVWRERRARRVRVAAARAPAGEVLEVPEAELEDDDAGPRRARRRGRAEPDIVDHLADRARETKPQQEAFRFDDLSSSTPYELPDVSIFKKAPSDVRSYDRDSLIMNSRILEKKLQDFGVGGQVVTVHPGPVITMYEFEPASGVKVNRIVGLADDLALALRALSVRIIAPLPGKSVVGIEVANPERETVYLRDVLESSGPSTSGDRLSIALGKDIFGNPAHADLARMPHLLVAGATGTGKSVFLNAILCSLLCRLRPDELKLLLIDPKLLELSIYEGIPHLIADVVTNPKRAAAALAGIVHKMEERYQMMSALGVRSIDQFNKRATEEMEAGRMTVRLKPKPGEDQGQELELRRFPYIVVVIDELADLMVVSSRDVEESLQRLAQMARAAGIHLILATQRPSVDVLTGVIKANFPARISFQVSSRTDSRTILDQNGADHLLGQGDMLFLPPGTSKLQRIHGAFVSEDEVTALTKFLSAQGAPTFDETLVRLREEAEAIEERGEDVDDMFDRAISIVADSRNASISYLQRRLKVGYNRAARMIEQMEVDGMVGPQEGNKPREVFVRSVEP
jgi:S-DNA-T family DNA segregation ATPase FtsK/SpoIIIE